jgi:hypothetical protein
MGGKRSDLTGIAAKEEGTPLSSAFETPYRVVLPNSL